MVDGYSKLGVDREDQMFDRECTDLEFWAPQEGGEQTLINFLGWQLATTLIADKATWQQTAEHL